MLKSLTMQFLKMKLKHSYTFHGDSQRAASESLGTMNASAPIA